MRKLTKPHFSCVKVVRYLGLDINLEAGLISAEERIKETRVDLLPKLNVNEVIEFDILESLVGRLTWICTAIICGRNKLFYLITLLREVGKNNFFKERLGKNKLKLRLYTI